MSMSTHIVGFRPADEKWKEMKTIWDACEKAGIDIPEAVEEFFDGEAPGDKPGAEVEIESALREWQDEGASGYEVDLGKLPKNVTVLRFYNSW